MKLLFVDNLDSFTYNVVHLLASQGASVDVVTNDDPALRPELLDGYAGVVVGPGPGRPADSAPLMRLTAAAIESGRPLLGVCLGLQAIGEALGARVVHAPHLMHGKVSSMRHDGSGIFAGLPSPLQATRYHSLCLEEASLPPELAVTARSEDGVVQGVAHRSLPVHGVQFHPESVLSEGGAELARNFLRLLRPPAAG